MELVLVRHGEPVRGASGEQASDPGIDAAGRRQAAQVAAVLAGAAVDRVYASTQRRARETAEIVAARCGLPVVLDDGIVEFDFGRPYQHFDGSAEANAVYASYLRGDLSAWGTDATTFRSRVIGALERIAGAHRGERVVVVTHGGVMNAYVGHVLGIEGLHWHSPAYCCLTRLRVGGGGLTTVVSVNETAHLSGVPCPDPSVHAMPPDERV